MKNHLDNSNHLDNYPGWSGNQLGSFDHVYISIFFLFLPPFDQVHLQAMDIPLLKLLVFKFRQDLIHLLLKCLFACFNFLQDNIP